MIVAVVLAGPGELGPAVQTAWQARAVCDGAVVALAEAEPGGTESALPPQSTVVVGDWQSDEGTAAVLAAAAKLGRGEGNILACVLGAGERLAAASWADARREIAEAGAAGLGLKIGETAECRVAPIHARFSDLIGRPDVPLADQLSVVPLASEPTATAPPPPAPAPAHAHAVSVIRTGTERTPAPPPPGSLPAAERLLAGLPPHLRGADAIADAVCGSDDAAHERLAEVLERHENRRLLNLARAGRDTCWAEPIDDAEPLVTIRIPTYNRGPLVAERALRSAAAQTYPNIEILVVGDCCDAATERAVRDFDDPRVRFINLPARGMYPDDPAKRWLVAGTSPVNAAMDLARGAWIAPCDDDDELSVDHVETLLGAARANRLEFVWSKARMELEAGQWGVVGNGHFAEGFISHGSVLFSAGLRFFRYRGTCWKIGEPGDWNLWRRMADAGVRMGFVDAVTYVHYLETPKREEAAP